MWPAARVTARSAPLVSSECTAFLSAGAYMRPRRLRKSESFLPGQNRFHLAISRLRSRSNAVAERTGAGGGGRGERRSRDSARKRKRLAGTRNYRARWDYRGYRTQKSRRALSRQYILPLFPPSPPP